jgi:A1 cistron-splicing factor AAR2
MPASLGPTPTVLIINLPPKSLVGIDLISFTSSPNFHGIRDLPSSVHFLYTGATESFSVRSGEWFFVQDATASLQGNADVRLRKWDKETETVVPADERDEAGRQYAMRLRANLGQIWSAGGLLPYRPRPAPQKNELAGDDTLAQSEWYYLSNYITPSLLSRILGPADTSREYKPRWIITSCNSAARDADHIPGLSAQEVACASRFADEEKELQFLPIDLKRTWREGAVGRERTEAARDRSWALGDLVRRYSDVARSPAGVNHDQVGESQILGEMQFTFLMILTLMNFSCLEQWKRILGLLLTCRAAIKAREGFFIEVLQLLQRQLEHCDDVEGGLFEMDADEGRNFLRNLLMGFRKAVDDVYESAICGVNKQLGELERWVKIEYGWELRKEAIVRRGLLELEDGEQVEMEVNGAEEEDETGEYAPVVVDLGDNGDELTDVDMVDTTLL